MSIKYLLSKQDTLCLLELIKANLYCTEEKDFMQLMRRLGHLIPYDFAISGLAQTDCNSIIISYDVLNISYPSEWLDIYIRENYFSIDPIVRSNFGNFKLQYWADTYRIIHPPRKFLSCAEDFGLKKGYTYGLKNIKRNIGSLFSVAGKSVERNLRTEFILGYIIPHFHQTLVRIFLQPEKKSIILSPREIEVLQWVKHGKSSWDISVILGVSERTIKFHVNNIMQKLDAVNRPHAVTIAFQMGLIDIE